MGNAIGQVLVLAVGVAISPIPLIGVALLLTTPSARSNGPAFLLGWVAGLAIVGVVFLLVSGGADASTSGSGGWVDVLKLLLGIGLLVLAGRQWRSRPRSGEEPELPGWMRSLDTFTAGRSAAVGAVLAANPKNFILVVGAATTIAQAGISAGSQAVALLVFIVVASAAIGGAVGLYLALGERSVATLDHLRDRLGRGNAAIMATLCLLIGAKLIGDAISGFSA